MCTFLEILNFIFRDFSTWLGTAILLEIIVGNFHGLIRISFSKIKNLTGLKGDTK